MNEQISVSEKALGYLKSTQPWVTFIAVMGFIGAAFMVLMSLFMLAGGALMPANPKLPAMFFPVFGGFYLLLSIFFCLIPGILLMRCSSAISSIPGTGQAAVESALSRQKSFWKYAGIFTIVILVFDVLIFIGKYGFGLFQGGYFHP